MRKTLSSSQKMCLKFKKKSKTSKLLLNLNLRELLFDLNLRPNSRESIKSRQSSFTSEFLCSLAVFVCVLAILAFHASADGQILAAEGLKRTN
mmetsp:Transcript_4368/g.10452  ORF Transcript_4368/g.10452 Transcript_4368/m.10452 type:complete len:93 (+) Transcript_4368:4553-4831(+)